MTDQTQSLSLAGAYPFGCTASRQRVGWALSAIDAIAMNKPGDHVAFPTTTRRPQEASP